MSYGTCGSLFSGIGLLDFGLHLAGWEHRWLCESDEWRRSVLRKRFPGAVVFDDVRTLRGEAAADADGGRLSRRAQLNGGSESNGQASERGRHAVGHCMEDAARPVTLLAGGFPCKGASTAGKREGFEHAETVLWGEMRRLVGELGPRYVLIENVANILGMAASPSEPPGSLWGTVLADLAALGFDVVWDCVPAAAVGAPHLRDRVFAIATNAERQPVELRRGTRALGSAQAGSGGETRQQRPGRSVADRDQDDLGGVAVEWGDYGPAIERWEAIHGTAPEPLIRRLDDGDAKLRRMRARVDRSRLSALGDGVHVYVGWLAGEYVMELERERRA